MSPIIAKWHQGWRQIYSNWKSVEQHLQSLINIDDDIDNDSYYSSEFEPLSFYSKGPQLYTTLNSLLPLSFRILLYLELNLTPSFTSSALTNDSF